jgi:hypothetical protein
MENLSHSKRSEILNEQVFKPAFARRKITSCEAGKNPLFNKLAAEDCEDFFYYLDWLELAKKPDMMILSSMHHYYYDIDDLKGIRILVNLKHLNRIGQLDGFLHSIYRLLPSGARFMGRFGEDKNREGMAIPLYQSIRFIIDIINLIDSRTEKRLTSNGVKKVLESHGFNIADMTEINGLIYFMAVNTRDGST